MSTSVVDTTQKIQLAIKAAPEQVWQALTDGSITPAYYVGFSAEFDLVAGAGYRYTAGGGDVITGTVMEVEPGRLLKTTFNGHWDAATAELPESIVTFRVFEPFMPMPGVTFLSCVHEGLPATEAAAHLEIGWVAILSGLKTLLETGQPLAAGPA
ncbi:MAG TPA: SRPBCC domain-containing protein [Pseudonocardia sp.]|nr:SRPBCC domain-containing protein [Pseudonocardia sp.]